MKILGLTGGIGSGKSVVAKIFATLGVAVFNSDERAKELYFDDDVREKVETLLGKKAYKSAGELDKDFVRSSIFSDPDLLKKINSIIHPAVKKDFDSFKKAHKKEVYIVKESALLFEAGIAASLDKVLLITGDAELRKKRVLKRDGLNKAEIENIMSRQWSDEEKTKKADWVIENNENKLLIPQVMKVHDALLG